MITPFKKLYSQVVDLIRLQDNVDNTLKSFITNPLLDGILITVSFSGVTVQQVNHKLARKPLGWIVVGKTTKTDVWVSSIDNSKLTVNVDNDVELTLFVF